MKNLPIGARVLVHIPTAGYVGVGSVVGEARRFDEALVEVNGVETALQSLPLARSYRNEGEEDAARAGSLKEREAR